MRILYVHNINQVAQTYGEDLVRGGHSVSVYEPSLAGAASLLPIKLAKMPGRILKMRNLVGNLKPDYYDLVHIHWASYGMLGLLSRIPYIVECHGSDIRYRLAHPFFKSVLTLVFRRAAAVICITPDLLTVAQTVRPDAIFLPGPVDTNRFVPGESLSSPRSDPWTILLFTRLDPIKGTEVTTKGIARFAQRHPDVRVLLFDWGPLKKKYKKCYGNRFEFLPFVPPQEIQNLIWSVDVIVGQSNLGILSFCELQAMSCAKPVIASFQYEDAYPSPPPLFRANTAEEVDEHLENLYQHPEIGKNIGRKSREWVINNHDRRVLAGKLETLYQTIIEGIGSTDLVQTVLNRD